MSQNAFGGRPPPDTLGEFTELPDLLAGLRRWTRKVVRGWEGEGVEREETKRVKRGEEEWGCGRMNSLRNLADATDYTKISYKLHDRQYSTATCLLLRQNENHFGPENSHFSFRFHGELC